MERNYRHVTLIILVSRSNDDYNVPKEQENRYLKTSKSHQIHWSVKQEITGILIRQKNS